MLSAQEEKLEVEGAIQIGNSEGDEPNAGTIRWPGTDFEGWDGNDWISLTGGFVKDIDIIISSREKRGLHVKGALQFLDRGRV